MKNLYKLNRAMSEVTHALNDVKFIMDGRHGLEHLPEAAEAARKLYEATVKAEALYNLLKEEGEKQ